MHGRLVTLTIVNRKDGDLPLISMAGYALSASEAADKMDAAIKDLESALQDVRRITATLEDSSEKQAVLVNA